MPFHLDHVFSWSSKKQQLVAQSSAEAEYVSTATAKATFQAIWLKRILEDIGEKQEEADTCIVTTNQL
jgi:hypothetical protein